MAQAGAQDRPPTLPAGLFDELELLYPDTPVASGADTLHVDVPRGSFAAAHVLIAPGAPADQPADALLEVRLDVTGLPLGAPVLYRLVSVPVEENTGIESRTERWDGRTNPFVVRRAPFRVFEAMAPATSPLRGEDSTLALRIELTVPPDSDPGSRSVSVTLQRGSSRAELELDVTVYAFVVPPTGRDTTRYTNWFSLGRIATDRGVEPWSEPFWDALQSCARLMARGRQNTFWVPWSAIFERGADGRPRLLTERLARYVATFETAGLWWIEGAPFARRPGGDWSRPDLELSIVDLPAASEAGRAALADMAGQLARMIEARGWRDRWLQHIADEPTDTNAVAYRELADVLREHLPGVPIVEATMCRTVAGAVDIWCPQVHRFQAHRDFFAERRALGERVWVYTCLVPGGPWLNRLLDQERLRPVLIGWALDRFDLDGFLHWGFNHQRTDPFAQSVVPHGSEPNNRLPAGDSHIVFPGPGGPWSGQRFEAHRIGLEDRECLRALRARDPRRADAIVGSVLRGFDDYTTSVADYRAARRKLLEAASEAGRRAGG